MTAALDIAVVGLSLRSIWGSSHAEIWRTLLGAMRRRGHRVRFYERAQPWHAWNRDEPDELMDCVCMYDSVESLREIHGCDVVNADVAMLGSRVSEGAKIADWLLQSARGITAFYDIDTPATLAKLHDGDCDYLAAAQIADFDLYLSCAGGPLLQRLRRSYGARARSLYAAVDERRYAPSSDDKQYDLGYIGSFSPDRQRLLRWYLLGIANAWSAGRFAMTGPLYPNAVAWPANVQRIEYLAPGGRRQFYNALTFALNLTREETFASEWSPDVRLFEAAACGLPIISDPWSGIEAFFAPGKEVLLAHEPGQVLDWLRRMPTTTRAVIGEAARRRVLAEHTGNHRAETLERYFDLVTPRRSMVPVRWDRAS